MQVEQFEPPYEGWRPYCLVCSTMARMEPKDGGYRCVACSNEIDADMQHRCLPGCARHPQQDKTT